MQLQYLSVAAFLSVASAQNLTSVLTSSPDLSNLTSYLQLFPALLSQLSQTQNITILAPTNAAFNKLLSSSAGVVLKSNDSAAIQAVLTYHVLSGIYPASAIGSTPAFVPTLLVDPKYTNITGGQRVSVVKAEGNVNVASGLKAISTVTKADLNFTGGVAHIIDTVLTLPPNVSTTAVASNLTALVGALKSVNLVNTLDSARDLTIFAPNNAAFQKIGSALGSLTTDQVSQILGYHVVNGTVAYSSTLKNQTIKSSTGQDLKITIENGNVFVNSAKVVNPDILVANGVVHVIDNVLNPNNTAATPIPTQSTQSVAFSGASSVTTVPFTSGITTPSSSIPSPTAASPSSSSGSSSPSSSRSSGAAAPMMTGSVGMAAMLGAGAAWLIV